MPRAKGLSIPERMAYIANDLRGADDGYCMLGLEKIDVDYRPAPFMTPSGCGNNQMFGDGCNDVLFGAAGSDGLTGGSGQGIFLFNTGISDADRVEDFDLTQVLVRFVNGGPSDFAALVPLLQQVGFDNMIDFGGGIELNVAFTDASALNPTDFHFVS